MTRKLFFMGLLLASFLTRAVAQTETLQVWGHDFEMTADGSTVTHLTVSERDVVDYTGFSLTILVPKGIHIAQVRSGREYVNDISLNVDRATTTHSIACNMPTEDMVKVISSSTENLDYYPDDIDGNPVDEIFTIGFTADPTMVNGEYEVKIVECKFAFAAGGASKPQEPIVMKMTVTGGVDGRQIDCTVGSAGVGTLILPFAAELPQDMQAYRCTGVDGTRVLMQAVDEIRANVPLLITALPGTYQFTGVPEGTKTSYTDGVLTGVMEETVITSGYVLQQQDAVAFYPVDVMYPITVPAYKCYLNYTGEQQAMRLDDVLTSLKGVTTSEGGATLYDLQGRRTRTATAPGVYIQNNRKIVKSKK